MGYFVYDAVTGVRFCDLSIIGYPGYRVGDDGSVWSRRIRGGQGGRLAPHWRRMKQTRLTDGTNRLVVSIISDAGRKRHYVHYLILSAFVGLRPEGKQACHFPDRDPTNNRLENLRWDTPKANMADRDAHETTARGERSGVARYSNATIAEIRRVHATIPDRYGRNVALSKQFGIPVSTIKKIVNGTIRRNG